MKTTNNQTSVTALNKAKAFMKTSAAVLFPLFLLQACTDGGPGVTEVNTPDNGNNGNGNYSGPPPATEDVQRFQTYLWSNILDKCGNCHNEGGQSPQFARSDDINLAYAEANTVVDLKSPVDSRLVEKVGGGHNCWLASNQACADTMTSYISNWAGNAASAVTEIQLSDPPNQNDPGATKTFPEDPSLFQSTVYPLLDQYCSNCHTDSASTPISPYFASSDISTAYNAAKSKINLDTPADSRFVVRLRSEFHNCWDGDCAGAATEMQTAIENFSAGIQVAELDPNAVHSKAITLLDGIPASSGGRYEANAIATWQFKTGSGTTAYDTSGIEPALDLNLSGEVEWVGGWGINLKGGKAQGSTSNSKKLHDMIKNTNEYAVEMWVAPANVTQEGPARIVTYSGGPDRRNFMVGQTLYNYNFLNRSSTTDGAGMPDLSTADADERLQATLQHVVVNYDPVNGRSIYVNGEFTGDMDPVDGGTLTDWDDSFALVLGSETNNDFTFSGVIKFMSIHNRTLNQEQITQNFEAGVGERFFLLFNITPVIDPNDSTPGQNDAYVVFEAAQWDSYGYLFNSPFFISLDETYTPNDIPMQGISIGINGKEVDVGQTYRNVDITLNATDYNSDSGQLISTLGTVIGLEKGPSADEFFLTFERLADQENVRIEADPLPLPTPPDADPAAPQIGVRTFEEINATLSQMTDVSMNEDTVRTVYLKVKQQLPTKEDVESFLSSHQMGVTQLAIQYCSALMDNESLRDEIFPDFNFTAQPTTAFTSEGRDDLIDRLLLRVMGTNLTSQPNTANVKAELNDLIDNLTTCGGSCESGRTVKVAKGVCAAAAGSALMLVQ